MPTEVGVAAGGAVEQSAVVVLVPEAEAAVADVRSALDRSAGWGVPAHVTVLFPWLPAAQVDAAALAALDGVVAGVPAFDLSFERIAWFGDDVVFLAPEPDAPLRTLTTRLCSVFPDTPPYGGAHAQVVPHLTIGHNAPLEVLRHAAATVSRRLPLRTSVTSVHVLRGTSSPNGWRVAHELRLGPAQG